MPALPGRRTQSSNPGNCWQPRRRQTQRSRARHQADVEARASAAGVSSVYTAVVGSIVNLNHPSHVVSWQFIHLSLPNVIVIVVMFVVFALAIALPFPGSAGRRRGRVS